MPETKPAVIVPGSEANIPVLPLRDVVVFPHMVIPLFVGRRKSIRALEQAMESGKQIMLVAQKSASDDDPTTDNIHNIGTIASILQLLKLPDGTVKVLVEGERRAVLQKYLETEDYFSAQVAMLEAMPLTDKEGEALTRSVLNEFDQYVKLNMKIPPEILTSLAGIDDPGRLADTVAAHLSLKIEDKQQILEVQDVRGRLEKILGVLESEIDLLQVEKRIRGRVKRQMEKSQREYYLNEQMKAIQKELGELEEGPNEAEELAKKIEKAGMSKEAREKAESELKKLKMMSPMSAEATVVRNYIDWLVNVPWKKRSKIQKDLTKAEEILEADHYGLEKVKERILEYLAVQQRVVKLKGPILCLVGPPGVGKTSLGQSIARATNRKFVRMSLGGVRDEAEIRGHRRTYIGSLPGKIIQNLSKVKVRNPLFMLDEVDKMAMDFRGDPSSALLEVLDPEQNHAFSDHYLEVDYDLSDVMFVATANTLNIPPPLLDRMEVIRLSGYTEDEKVNIAIRYLIPKQLKNNGLKEKELHLSEKTIRDIVRYYTREAGVRNLEREIAKICRKVTKELLLNKDKAEKTISVTPKSLEKYLGVQRFRYGTAEQINQVGQVTGLAWTEVGGELLTIEATILPGKGKLTITGKLGDVMQESIQAAMSVVRARATKLGIMPDFYQKHDFHVHVPEGATPKDGPSAGIAMCTAMVSALSKIPVRAEVAMTGEITLRGEVLPIGGLKEKLLAAHRGNLKVVLIPEENRKDLTEIPKNIRGSLDIRPVRWIDQVLEAALEHMPEPLDESKIAEAAKPPEAIDSVNPVRTH
ncbi:MAG: endopeptidase La [Candidatus Muproteobacteria bacterium RIFCSPHIGHO2_12_FULL_60_33]|uniref:Lon protease n=1 Tax=Candidatus Muproteobacteria bacterium RIFCSPLOWO2_01_FULL_60_18 TaxID=1817768 RepID=A0A1F6U5R4_9PROT|nr:MAG: endopeptidase La [Candidatus Muproteobacteria bacterium RIFCSPHIGHO2_01_60_12]OGI52682.1 MAG: endopeptidase La [Candidatus Muproteobacteria bacterium RIFCSPLOWO2_01_FULL_60_18]OGI54597.1 MAG: endopeptidase La [Candidatus Muproteobacteria bacterium RIFCSPHIGHO2_12_FULL_60_33]OGI59293.1 MAG: endopeptidase La [Candidatus Muproteobacteria bacterium RIFCSPHIGHO2_01_FULL_61_200]